VDIEDLQLFRDIARTRHLSRGAASNGVSQSAATQRLQEVEKGLGVKLLDRSTRPVAVTPAGRLYLDFCCDVLRRKERLDAELDELRARIQGSVRVASIYSVGLSDMTRLRREFETRWPQASLDVEYLRPDKIYEAVIDGSADIGIVSYAEPIKSVAAIPWRNEPMAVAAAPSHALASRETVEPSDLQGLEFIAFDPELPIRRAIDRFLREQGVEVVVSMYFDNIQMVKEAVAVGAGVSILPRRALGAEIELGRLAAVPMRPEITRPLALLHRRGRKFNQATLRFLELLLESGEHGGGRTDVEQAGECHDRNSVRSPQDCGDSPAIVIPKIKERT
jgi:LysR family transcriptional regulator, transcriptional activator of the cysJI operon